VKAVFHRGLLFVRELPILRLMLLAAAAVAANAQTPAYGPPTTADGSLSSIYGNKLASGLTLADSIPLSVPTINAGGVVSAAGFQAGIVPGSYVSIQGTNLSPVALDFWDSTIVNGNLPTSLDGVSVSIAGKPAFVYVVSPTQINVQAPDVGTGPVPVTVTTAGGTSVAVTANVLAQSPAFFLWPGVQPVATRLDGTFAVKAGTFPTLSTLAAKPGDVLILWGTGFGPTTPPVSAGILVPGDQFYFANSVSIKIGTVDAQIIYALLSPGYAGLYQVAFTVPASMADGDYALTATVSGVSSPDGVTLTVKK
jgi:uncharacterized protein (TIGR03437 family)